MWPRQSIFHCLNRLPWPRQLIFHCSNRFFGAEIDCRGHGNRFLGAEIDCRGHGNRCCTDQPTGAGLATGRLEICFGWLAGEPSDPAMENVMFFWETLFNRKNEISHRSVGSCRGKLFFRGSAFKIEKGRFSTAASVPAVGLGTRS